VTLIFSVTTALVINRLVFGQKEVWDAHNVFGR